MNRKITFMSDPSHGWISVPRKDLELLEIIDKISEFSYQKGNRVYLEEDIDAPLYIKEAENRGWVLNIKESHTNKRHWIRYTQNFQK